MSDGYLMVSCDRCGSLRPMPEVVIVVMTVNDAPPQPEAWCAWCQSRVKAETGDVFG